jgi:NOL1/NOP2/fmu family ribosome biogenesis protein
MSHLKLIPLKEKKELIEKLSYFYNTNTTNLEQNTFYINEKTSKIYITNTPIEETKLNIKRINSLGLYFGTYHDNNRFRLSIEGSRLISPKKNYIILNKKSLKSFIAGENLFKEEVNQINWEDKCPFLIVKYKNDNLGCANIKETIIINYTPKSRRLNFDKLF